MVRLLLFVAIVIVLVLFGKELKRLFFSTKKEDDMKDAQYRSQEVDVDEDIILTETETLKRRRELEDLNQAK